MKTNASELYGHIETIEQRLQHLFTLREIQDETHGFQAFISFPFHPQNTQLDNIKPITSYEACVLSLFLDLYWITFLILKPFG